MLLNPYPSALNPALLGEPYCKQTIPKICNKYSWKGIEWPQSQFPHSCVCERFIYSHDRSVYSATGKYVDRSWEYTNCSQTHKLWKLGLRPRHSFSGNSVAVQILTIRGFFPVLRALICRLMKSVRRILSAHFLCINFFRLYTVQCTLLWLPWWLLQYARFLLSMSNKLWLWSKPFVKIQGTIPAILFWKIALTSFCLADPCYPILCNFLLLCYPAPHSLFLSISFSSSCCPALTACSAPSPALLIVI